MELENFAIETCVFEVECLSRFKLKKTVDKLARKTERKELQSGQESSSFESKKSQELFGLD